MKSAAIKNTALILAPDEKGQTSIFGVPAVRRLALLCRQSGFEPLLIARRIDLFRLLLSDLLPADAFHHMDDPGRLEGLVAGLAISEKSRLLVLTADLVLDRRSLALFLENSRIPGSHLLTAEEGSCEAAVFVGGPADMAPLLGQLWRNEGHLELPPHIRRTEGVAGLPVRLGDTSESAKIAENRLIAALSSQTEADDGFFSRHFDRRVSRFISRRLAHTPVSPNQITLAGVAIGLTGAFLLSLGGYWSQLAGALLFLFCIIADGVDGEVARLKLRETAFGHYLDVVTDNVVHVAVFAGIAFGLYHDAGDAAYLHALWWMLGGFGLCVVAVYRCILRRTPEELDRSPRLVRLLAMLSNRDFAYLVAALAIVHRLDWFLLGAAVGTYLFAATLWLLGLYEDRRIAPETP